MNEDIKFVYLRSHPLFAGMDEQKIKEASSYMRVRTIYRGEIFHNTEGMGSRIFLLLKGKIKIATSGDGNNEHIKDIITSPDIFGDLCMEGKPDSSEYAEALTANTIICSMLAIDLKRIISENPNMALRYAHIVNLKLKRLESRHADLVLCDAKSRLIRFIKNLAFSDGNRVGDKIVVNNYLTHSEIAGVIATSRQSVNILLNELRDSGYLFYNRKTIEINNLNMLN